MMSVKTRFDKLIHYYSEGNKKLFSERIGVSPSVIENVVGKREGNPSFELLRKIKYAFADVSIDWLLTGEGSMLKANQLSLSPEGLGNLPNSSETGRKCLDVIEELEKENEKLADQFKIAIQVAQRVSNTIEKNRKTVSEVLAKMIVSEDKFEIKGAQYAKPKGKATVPL